MILGTTLHAQSEKGKAPRPIIDSFYEVIDMIPNGSIQGLLSLLNPLEMISRRKAEEYQLLKCPCIYNRRLNAEIAKAVQNGQKSRTKECGEYQTVLDLAREDEEYGRKATVPELVDQVKTFLFAGHDTSASTISWVFYYLSIYPEIHVKMRAEHDAVLGPFTDTDTLAEKLSSDPRLLAKLDYTLAVIREVLRLRPVTDGVREGPPGYALRTAGGIEFDVSELMICTQHQALHTNEPVWGSSASRFDPERFLGPKSIPVGYMPFSTRPRDCIGRNLAYLEARPKSAIVDNRGNLHLHSR